MFLLLAATALGQEADRWWSLKRLKTAGIPQVQGVSGWPRNPIDAFILARLTAAGLAPSESADRRTLIRRATFDLHGLPPSPEEIEAFVNDGRPDAFERLVDRLLASPRYGERWARHWLDVAHYGDTHGYDKDKVRPNAWPYRDWVIRALNDDMPWARFVEMQIAGDVLSGGDPDGVIATGFVAAGPWDFVGHVELREGTVDKEITRNLDRDDMVTSTMSAFASLTVHCARCHDHKFDPISQSEYYGLQAVFAGVERADRAFDPPQISQRRQGLEARLEALQASMKDLAPEQVASEEVGQRRVARDAAKAALAALPPAPAANSPSNGWHSLVMSGPLHEKWVEVDLGAPQVVDEVVLWPARPQDFPDTPGFGFPTRWSVVVSASADGSGGRALARHLDDAPNPGDGPVRISGDGAPVRVIRVIGHRLWERRKDWVMALSELQVMVGGKDVARGKTVRAKDSIESGLWSKRHLVDGHTSRHAIGEVPDDLRRRRELEAAVARCERALSVAALEAERARYPERAARREGVRVEMEEVAKQLAALPDPSYVYAAAPTFKREGTFTPAPGGLPRPVHVLERGDVDKPGAPAVPGALACVEGVSSTFRDDMAAEGRRRSALARWLTDRDNPLTWRSAVNRVWHHHFGRGLVSTPNDFGKMGARPSHPALLDWLAMEFRDSGGSLKVLHRAILSSAVWRQASAHDAARAAKDSGNRLLWRANRRRLEAEAVRDAVLSVAGALDFKMGGPGYRTFGFKDDHSPHYMYDRYDADDRGTWRRAVYRFQVRSVPDPFLETMDCPDPSRSTPVRAETVTALQALSLLNNRFMLRQARSLAERATREAEGTSAQVARAFSLSLGRDPDPKEHERMTAYAGQYGLPALCRLLFNLNEFLFID
ncbi:MAG: cytochrome C [Planctomycetes bacterium]|nr:cytochrome C [Planctomycetota bacterium]